MRGLEGRAARTEDRGRGKRARARRGKRDGRGGATYSARGGASRQGEHMDSSRMGRGRLRIWIAADGRKPGQGRMWQMMKRRGRRRAGAGDERQDRAWSRTERIRQVDSVRDTPPSCPRATTLRDGPMTASAASQTRPPCSPCSNKARNTAVAPVLARSEQMARRGRTPGMNPARNRRSSAWQSTRTEADRGSTIASSGEPAASEP